MILYRHIRDGIIGLMVCRSLWDRSGALQGKKGMMICRRMRNCGIKLRSSNPKGIVRLTTIQYMGIVISDCRHIRDGSNALQVPWHRTGCTHWVMLFRHGTRMTLCSHVLACG